MKSMKKIVFIIIILLMMISLESLATTGQQIVDYAKQYLNYPYGWGREGIDSKECKLNHTKNGKYYDKCFDCSGFVWYVYTQCGVNVGGRCLAADFAVKGINVPNNVSLQPGDVLIFRNGQHVAIYIGNNQYIHANGSQSKTHWASNSGCVQISNIGYDTITARRRIIKDGTFNPKIIPPVTEYKLPEIKPNFEVYVTDENGVRSSKSAEKQSNGAIIKIDEKEIKKIELVNCSNIKGMVEKWQIYNLKNNNWEDIPGKTDKVEINWSKEKYDKNTDTAGYIRVRLVCKGENAPTKEIKLNPVGAYMGTKVKVEIDGKINEYELKEYTMNEIVIAKNSKIQLESNAAIEYRLWDPNGQKTILIPEGKIDNANKYLSNVIKLAEGFGGEKVSYQARIGITRNGGDKEGYDIVIKIAEKEIRTLLNGKEIVGDKENPIIEGVYVTNIDVENRTGLEVSKWELFNAKENRYVVYGGTENKKNLSIKEINRINQGGEKYSIKIRLTLSTGEQLEKEIYISRLKIETPENNEKISSDKDLKIKWNGEEERKYYIRMVEYSYNSQGKETTKEIVQGDTVTGNSYIIPKEELKENSNYRIAIKEENGNYYYIIVITTIELEQATISNYEEIKENKVGENIRVKLEGKAAGDEYVITLYNSEQQLIDIKETYYNEIEVINNAKEGTYIIGVSVIREGVMSTMNIYTIEVK